MLFLALAMYYLISGDISPEMNINVRRNQANEKMP